MKNNRQVILIAGPAASGKTVLLRKIKNGQCPHLCERLGITDVGSWHFTNDRNPQSAQNAGFERLIVHYDLYNQNNGEKIHRLLLTADHITTLTLCIPPHVLVARNKKRILKNLNAWWMPTKQSRKYHAKKVLSLSKRQKRNKNKTKVLTIYNNWFDLLQKHQATSYWVDSTSLSNDPVIHPLKGDRTPALQLIQSAKTLKTV